MMLRSALSAARDAADAAANTAADTAADTHCLCTRCRRCFRSFSRWRSYTGCFSSFIFSFGKATAPCGGWKSRKGAPRGEPTEHPNAVKDAAGGGIPGSTQGPADPREPEAPDRNRDRDGN